MVESSERVMLLTRPRWFGKTLNLDPPPVPANESFLDRINRLSREAQRLGVVTALRAGADPRYVGTAPADPADRNHVTRIEVVFRTDPFTPASMGALEAAFRVARKATEPGGPLAGATAVGLGGSTAMVNDLAVASVKDSETQKT